MTTATESRGLLEARPFAQLGPSVPEEVMAYVQAYGDSRADEDGLSAVRIGETVLALRRWAAQVQAAERDRWRGAALAGCDGTHQKYAEALRNLVAMLDANVT